MKIHHLNCGTLCPAVGKLAGGDSWFSRGLMVCHCWLIETKRDGLVLVDTGMGLREHQEKSWKHQAFSLLSAPAMDDNEAAISQVKRLGFTAQDVRHIVVTHLDLDHAGGLVDFPHAQVHVHNAELQAAQRRSTSRERQRYWPSRWAHEVLWQTYDTFGDLWHGLPAAKRLHGLHDDIALIPLIGHTRGHSAVAVELPGKPMLHCGDAIYHHDELVPGGRAPWTLHRLANMMEVDRSSRLASVAALQLLAAEGVDVMCAHDPAQLPTNAQDTGALSSPSR